MSYPLIFVEQKIIIFSLLLPTRTTSVERYNTLKGIIKFLCHLSHKCDQDTYWFVDAETCNKFLMRAITTFDRNTLLIDVFEDYGAIFNFYTVSWNSWLILKALDNKKEIPSPKVIIQRMFKNSKPENSEKYCYLLKGNVRL